MASEYALPATMKAVIYDKKAEDGIKFEQEFSTDFLSKFVKKNKNCVLLKVKAVGLNPVDYKSLDIPPANLMGNPVGIDCCGEILACQADSGFKVGDLAWGSAGTFTGATGPLAEYVGVLPEHIHRVPEGGDPLVYGSIPVALGTVVTGYERAGFFTEQDAKGKTAVVIGASGGCGSFAVQYAANFLKFDKVYAVCSAKNAELVRTLGATDVVDYNAGQLSSLIPENSCDHVFDCVTNHAAEDPDYSAEAQKLLKVGNGGPKGTGGFLTQIGRKNLLSMIFFLVCPKWLGGMPHSHYDFFMTQVNPGLMAKATEAVSCGKVKPAKLIQKEFSEAGCREAFKQLKSQRTVGKIVVQL